MKTYTFDDFTKALASPSPRRAAFRRFAGLFGLSSVGAASALGFSSGVALASGGNSDCADFCNAVFAPGSARGQCKSDAAQGTGLCFTCGPKSSGGSKLICCSTDSNGQCTSYSSATCCSSGQTCSSGSCVSACTAHLTACDPQTATCCDSLDACDDHNGVFACCREINVSCTTDADCCHELVCVNVGSSVVCSTPAP